MELKTTIKRIYRGAVFAVLPLAIGCSQNNDDSELVVKPARPVSYIELNASQPQQPFRISGSVGSWKQEMLSFEVGGVVNYVLEPGTLIDGRVVSDAGAIEKSGTTLASLGNRRFQLRRSEARASVSNVRAEFERAKKELDRQTRLLNEGAGAQGFVDTAKAKFESARAQLSQAREAYERSDIDVSDTELYSPFNGQVSKVHVIPGGYVERGQPVLTVQMMDPLKIEVAVSPKKDREINFNDLFDVYVDGRDEPLKGWVWNKDAVADAATRTFMLTLLVRNHLIETETAAAHPDAIPTTALWNIEAEHANGKPPWFINEQSLHEDERGQFVWKVEGVDLDDDERNFEDVFKITKVRVTASERKMRFLQLMTYRELENIGELDPERDLLTAQLSPLAKEGDAVYLDRKSWLLRPGQLVDVDLHKPTAQSGYYAPASAVIKDAGGHHIFVLSEDENSEQLARRQEIEVRGNIGSLQEIMPLNANEFDGAQKLIVDGAQYVRDGERVNAFAKAGGAK